MFFDLDILTPYIEIILPVSVIIAIMLALVPFMGKKYVARARYFIWLIIALRLIFPFDINLSKKPTRLIHATVPDKVIIRDNNFHNTTPGNIDSSDTVGNHTESPIDYNNNYNTENNNIDNTIVDVPPGAEVTYTESGNVIVKNNRWENPVDFSKFLLSTFPVIRISTVIANLWIYTAVLLMIYHILQYFTVRITLNKNSAPDSMAQQHLDYLSEKLGIRKAMKVYRTSSTGTAMIVGLLSPAIFIPDIDYSTDVLDMVLYHELMHHKRKDILYKFILLVACCIHWYNPLVWLMDRQAQKDIEIACDEDVIKNRSQEFKDAYSSSIISMIKMNSSKRLAFSTGFSNDKKTLATRFKNIYDNSIKRSGKSAIALIIALCILSTSLISCAPEKAEEAFQVPDQAMDFIQTYCEYERSYDYWDYENFGMGFWYLYRNNMIKDEHIYHYDDTKTAGYYSVPWEQMMDIYQFMFAREMPAEWWSMSDQVISTNWALVQYDPRTHLTVLETEKIDENTFTVIVAREADGVPLHHLQFEMSKQIIDYIPEYLTDRFTAGEEIWRIKNVVQIENILNPNPQTVEINNIDDFLLFVDNVNTNGYYIKGNTYLLNCDLDLAGIEIDPIGSLSGVYSTSEKYTDASGGFCATFDGQGHTISNLEIIYDGTDNSKYNGGIGLFTNIASEGVVKNLNIVNANIVSVSDKPYEDHGNNIGILAGYCTGTVINCHVSGNVQGYAGVGGMFGYIGGLSTTGDGGHRVNGYVENCTSNATVTGCQETAPFAGIIHYAKIVNCSASGTSTGIANPYDGIYDTQKPWRIAGFGGTVICSELENCHADTNLVLKNTARIVGAFCATRETSSFKDCTYNPVKAGNWKVIGYEFHNGWTGTENIGDVKPIKQ
ncbi:MAG: hypothetical protein IKU54_02600 [Oscillospiraceae bacterium]|nr:hypothetical protein [Oscillospiraceae bacterium]